MKLMNKDEFLATYGEWVVHFIRYYKYGFTFGVQDLTVTTLGVTDYMYRADITRNMSVRALWHELPLRVEKGGDLIFENWSDEGY